jgi:hypothetical protein
MNKFSELDDSRRAMYILDAKKAREKGLRTPEFRPRNSIPKPSLIHKNSNGTGKTVTKLVL